MAQVVERLPLTILIERKAKRWIAHCLEFDLATEAASEEAAKGMIADAIFEYLSYAVEHGLEEHLFRPAPPECWNRVIKAGKRETVRPRLPRGQPISPQLLPEFHFSITGA